MRIALVSYEFLGGASGGGIGTYARNAAFMLASRGHDVEVFTSKGDTEVSIENAKFLIHSIRSDRRDFSKTIVPAFASRHLFCPFDVIEGPEFGAEASDIADTFPEIALIVKLHGPTFTINASNNYHVGWRPRLRFFAGAVRRVKWPTNPWRYYPEQDPERQHANKADMIVANSRATAARVSDSWKIAADRIMTVPLVFLPPSGLSEISERTNTQNGSLHW